MTIGRCAGTALAFLAAGAVTACHGRDRDHAEAAVRAVETAQLDAYRRRDVDGVLAGYAPDATVMVAGRRAATGTDAIRRSVERALGDPAFSIRLANATTMIGTGLAYARGRYRVTYTDPESGRPAAEEGYYLTVFRRGAGGEWLAIEDITTPAAPRPRG